MLWTICATNSMEIQSDFKELLELFNSHIVEYLVTGAYAQSDFKELLELFNSHIVEYLVTGAYALAFHGAPRYTIIISA